MNVFVLQQIHFSLFFSIFFLVVEPPSNLQVTEIASKSMRVMWDASIGEITGYKITLIPMVPGMKRQELYMGATQTSINVRDLSPETEYEISLYALKGLTPSEPIMDLAKTQPVKVSTGKVFHHATSLSQIGSCTTADNLVQSWSNS